MLPEGLGWGGGLKLEQPCQAQAGAPGGRAVRPPAGGQAGLRPEAESGGPEGGGPPDVVLQGNRASRTDRQAQKEMRAEDPGPGKPHPPCPQGVAQGSPGLHSGQAQRSGNQERPRLSEGRRRASLPVLPGPCWVGVGVGGRPLRSVHRLGAYLLWRPLTDTQRECPTCHRHVPWPHQGSKAHRCRGRMPGLAVVAREGGGRPLGCEAPWSPLRGDKNRISFGVTPYPPRPSGQCGMDPIPSGGPVSHWGRCASLSDLCPHDDGGWVAWTLMLLSR